MCQAPDNGRMKEKGSDDITELTIVLTLIWGVAIGSIYMLLATGLNIIFGVMKLVNFAHGQFLMIGAFLTWTISVATGLNAYKQFLFPWCGCCT